MEFIKRRDDNTKIIKALPSTRRNKFFDNPMIWNSGNCFENLAYLMVEIWTQH